MDPYIPIIPYEMLAKKLGRDTDDIVKLDANESPFGPSPSVRIALAEAKYLHIYPDPDSTFLRQALEKHTNLSKDYIMVGAGADELIDLMFRLFIDPAVEDSIINCTPTFGMYRFSADVNGARIIKVPRKPDMSLDINAIERVFEENPNPPKLIFIASPNNPDGSVLSDHHLERLLALPTVVVVDEAYVEFADTNRIPLVPEHDNLVVLRTFSKWAGLAGMRVGYGAFPLPIIKHLQKIKPPYNVSVAAQVAAIASLNDRQHLMDRVDRMIEQRKIFYRKIAKYDWLKPYPSQSNYVLCRVVAGRQAAAIRNDLADRGILIRYYDSPDLSDCIRVSMGTEQQMDKLYAAFAEL